MWLVAHAQTWNSAVRTWCSVVAKVEFLYNENQNKF